MIDKLDVMIWGEKAGTLVSTPKGYSHQILFYFDADFIKKDFDLSPIHASIHSNRAQNGLPFYPEDNKLFGGLPSFIADSLPDHWGNLIFAEWAKTHKIRNKDISPLDRLAYIGRRGMGALEFVPPTSEEMEKPFKVEIEELSRLAQMALKEAKNFHAIMSPDFIIESLFKIGTSAGGRRPKAVINVNLQSGECYSGQVSTPLPGFVPMIIKFDEHSDLPTTRIEYSYHLMALIAGLHMMPSYLLEGERETHFLTERFDRKGNNKIHIQTLAALNPLSSSYEELFETAVKIRILPEEIQQLYLMMVMNVMGGNVDDHNKNFSFMMDKDCKWHIAPAYDFTFSVDTSAPYYINRQSLSICDKNQDINIDDLLSIADMYNIKSATTLINRAKEAISNYRSFAQKAGVAEPYISMIENEIASRLQQLC